ncbi:MAG: response regulator [Candidatus Obscuribacterales bacterium]|nr:response regulator [Candidatus Obscuribacterales bacterium]
MGSINAWQKLISEQRAEFLQHARAKLADIESSLNLLEESLWESAQIQNVARLFHQLAGSGGFFDLHEFCAVAGKAEGVSLQLLSKRSDLKKEDLVILRQCAANLSKMLESNELTIAAEQAHFAAEYAAEQRLSTDLLLVSGDPRALVKISKYLEEFNIEVRTYRTESSAEQAAQSKMPDAVIIHVPLSEGSGYDLAQKIRKRAGGQKIPILLLSGEGGFLSKVNAIRAGVDNFFEAPFDLKQVGERLQHLLDRDKPEMFRILSVEDDAYQGGLIKSTLEAAGYNTMLISDPRDFEDALLAFCPDLLLLDIDLGAVNGFELAKYVRQNDRFAALPIIFLTTHNQLAAHIETARAGGDDHLVKPVSPQYLIATIAGRLERYRSLRKLTMLDGLTQCMTYSNFMDTAAKQVERSRGITRSTLMIFDVDNIGQINQQFGFAQGDRVIQALARVIQNTLRQTEMICRAAGDEIVVLLENLDDTEVAQIGSHILYDFQSIELLSGGQKYSATASAGACALDSLSLDDALKAAQAGLQIAKQQGKNRLVKAVQKQPNI